MLVEPLDELQAVIAENYGHRPNVAIIHGAISLHQQIHLHSISAKYWSDFSVPYATTWPLYRAPLGVTSENYAHVEDWCQRYYAGSESISNLIETRSVPGSRLLSILETHHLESSVDILVVDVEGAEEDVLKACDLDHTRPRLIVYENEHLSNMQSRSLNDTLEQFGYRCHALGANSVAFLALQENVTGYEDTWKN